jgi:four helix bundle protein
VSDFKKLHVWQKAHALSLSIDRMCKRIRGSRYASLRSQIYRAAMSIPANIAEGSGKNSDRDFARFVGYALGSSSELEYHLIVARDTKVIPEGEFVSSISQTITVRKMLYGLLNCLGAPKREAKATKTTPEESPQP